jgi:hypothetical protein
MFGMERRAANGMEPCTTRNLGRIFLGTLLKAHFKFSASDSRMTTMKGCSLYSGFRTSSACNFGTKTQAPFGPTRIQTLFSLRKVNTQIPSPVSKASNQ